MSGKYSCKEHLPLEMVKGREKDTSSCEKNSSVDRLDIIVPATVTSVTIPCPITVPLAIVIISRSEDNNRLNTSERIGPNRTRTRHRYVDRLFRLGVRI